MIKFKKTAAGVAAAAMAALALPGAAQAACPTAPVFQAFAQFGDVADYYLAPGGGFEAGQAAWTLSGAKVAAGNEPWYLSSSTDKQSVQLAARGNATSPTFCVDASKPTLRLAARQLSGRGSTLRVEVLYGPTKSPTAVLAGAVTGDGSTAWRVGGIMNLANALPLNTSADGTMQVRLRVSADLNGSWAVDDVFVDPYRR